MLLPSTSIVVISYALADAIIDAIIDAISFYPVFCLTADALSYAITMLLACWLSDSISKGGTIPPDMPLLAGDPGADGSRR